MSAIVNKLNDLLSILNDGNKTEKERANAIGFTVPQYRMFIGFIKQARSNARKMDKDVPGPMPKPETGGVPHSGRFPWGSEENSNQSSPKDKTEKEKV